MKAGIWLLLAGALQAGGIEGTVWYDSKGEVAWVEGPASREKAREPFVPHWVREKERRDRASRGGYRSYRRYDRDYYAAGYHPVTRWRGWPVSHRHPAVRCVRPVSGVRVIIR